MEYLMSSKFIKNLNILMRTNEDPILIHMKTCGGDWIEGMAIYEALLNFRMIASSVQTTDELVVQLQA